MIIKGFASSLDILSVARIPLDEASRDVTDAPKAVDANDRVFKTM